MSEPTPGQREMFPEPPETPPDNGPPRTEDTILDGVARALAVPDDHLPPDLGKPVPVPVPNFADPNRPKTCLEVDFPIVPINELSRLEGNAGKPIYQMSKWWARRRSCVFRAMLIAAAMEAPQNPDDAHQAVWDVYYANHQQAGNFGHLKVLDCFMGGGTTLVEGSRLGFQVAGVDLNPVAWFIVKNELACPDPDQVKAFFDRIEEEVKPQVQPFYATDCPRGHKGRWFDTRTGQPANADPATLPPEQRRHYRYEGPEVIYTFWAKHGPCQRQHQHGGSHRTPVFRSPVIAEKRLGVKYMELTCKQCKTTFHAELGSARMAPGAERVILPSETPFTELSQPFANLLAQYDEGKKPDRLARIRQLEALVDAEPGLKCPKCRAFAGEWVKNILDKHLHPGGKWAHVKKKDFKIRPERNSMKPVYCYLLIHPVWLKGSPGEVNGRELGGYAEAMPDADAAWYEERLKGLKLIEVRGRIKLAEEGAVVGVGPASRAGPEAPTASRVGQEMAQPARHDGGAARLAAPTGWVGPASRAGPEAPATARHDGGAARLAAPTQEAPEEEDEGGTEAEERKKYGLPRYITLAGGTRLDTRNGTVPEEAHFTCGACGLRSDLRVAVKDSSKSAPVTPYALQGYCPDCAADGHIYGGRYFQAPTANDFARLVAAERDWAQRRDADLADCWPREEIPHTYMTHQANFALPDQGYTHWWKMFNPRQLLVHASLLKAVNQNDASADLQYQALGAIQQYLRNQNMFCIWDRGYDKIAPFFSNSNYAAKLRPVENSVFGTLGRGNWTSTVEGVIEGVTWARHPWEVASPEYRDAHHESRIALKDRVLPGADTRCMSATELGEKPAQPQTYDLAITDPPFGDNVFYSDLANFFYVWLRLPLRLVYPNEFDRRNEQNLPATPNDQEAVKPRTLPEHEANDHYRNLLTPCWLAVHRVLKDGGLLAFTFHHSEDEQWAIVLQSLFDAGFVLEATYPVNSDEAKGENASFGAKGTEYDMIHVCRKRLAEPTRVSWVVMRRWVKNELERLRPLLESYKARRLSEADMRVILRGKALEFYSRHYGEVYTTEEEPLSIRNALLGINQLLDEDPSNPGERPPSIIQPGVAYQFLRLFRGKTLLPRDDVGKQLRGTGISLRALEEQGWVSEENKWVHCVPIPERFEMARQRPRKQMKTEIDQAHFLIGAALPDSGVNIEQELDRDTWMVRRSVEAVLDWYHRTAPQPDIRQAAGVARDLLRRHIEQRRAQRASEQRSLFDDLDDDIE
jgi:putative DNA methylase